MKIGILGGEGFLGSKLVEELGKEHETTSITRWSYFSCAKDLFDIFINAAGNNRNYWGNQYPNEDFKVSTQLAYDSLFHFQFSQYIFLSSIATYEKQNHYGFNKLLSEQIITRYSSNYLILRCSAVIDKTREIGFISDAIKGIPLGVTADSEIQYVTRDAFVDIVKTFVTKGFKKEIYNVGGLGTIKIGDLEEMVGRPLVFKKDAQKRYYWMDVSELEKQFDLKYSYEYVKEVIF